MTRLPAVPGFSDSFFDFSRPPNEKERVLLERRRRRLEDMSTSVDQATMNLCELAAGRNLEIIQIRNEFVFRPDPAPGDPSDRKLPAREHRPPCTRLMSPRGAALRLMLIALFEAQIYARAGKRRLNNRPLQAPSQQIGWTDLLASDARPSGAGKTYMGIQAKKGRHIRNALSRLNEEELVALPLLRDPGNKYEKYEGFLLQHEGGRRAIGPNDVYHVPRKNEPIFTVPASLFTNGWIHVLEDTELAFLLMLAYLQSGQPNAEFRVPSDTRVLHLCIGRDAYEAHKLFDRLDIASVTIDPGRHLDGKVENYGKGVRALPHTFRLLPTGLEQNGLAALMEDINYQISRCR